MQYLSQNIFVYFHLSYKFNDLSNSEVINTHPGNLQGTTHHVMSKKCITDAPHKFKRKTFSKFGKQRFQYMILK